MKRTIYLLLVFSFFLFGCNKDVNLEKVEPGKITDRSNQSEAEIILPLSRVDTLNPLLTQNEDYFQLSKLLYDQLFIVQPNGTIVPSITDHYERLNNGYTLTVTIKDNIYWQDGTKLTAYDVAATFNALKLLPETSPYYDLMRSSVSSAQEFNIEGFAQAKVFDEKNVDFIFDRPYGNILQLLTFPILPAHLLTADEMINGENFIPVSSGPFLFESFESNKELVLKKNTNYHGNIANVDKIIAKVYPSQERKKQAFDAEQLDILYLRDYTWENYRSNPSYRMESFETSDVEVIACNMQDSIFQGEGGAALRRAMQRGINKRRIISSLLLSQATPADFFINSKISGGLFTKEPLYSSIDTARDILKEAGFVDSNQDGFVENSTGENISLTLLTSQNDYKKNTEAQLIAEDLRSIGIECNVVAITNQDEVVDRVRRGEYQMVLVGFSFSMMPDMSRVLYSGAELNISRYSNEKMDALLKDLSITWKEEDKSSMYDEIYRQFSADLPMIPLYFKQGVLIRNEDIHQNLNPSSSDIYQNVKNISKWE